ncbi:conserved hypothetical protein [Candidatus Accumulibacter aalborgensis]|uniref:RiboL-PSP-HEPN domain-containing protein n=1 Tax=Candidatus Accumulibacter aalborgensis TaxID=1860102 RepID=A0A1A8XY02_9PROT|nr:MAE_28990/MAE_18760 family HEPN-like nuclease [Candidatus Accumulibacter aalborgensis]SBT09855.1 conserved hypothetical protein [Candidatus Accumulibacter aalborgensis]
MTKYVTAEQCLDAIQSDSAWRKKEISSFKQRVAGSDGEARAIMMRAGILILYAHWEGFVKFSSETYITHINERIARFNAPLNEHYQTLRMWRCIQRKGDYPHSKTPVGFLDVMQAWKSRPDKKLSDDMIDAESNLNSIVLRKILRIIDIPFGDFESKQNLIDEKLLGRRNPIAHGEKMVINFDEYNEADREVRMLLETFQQKIEGCIQNSSFVEK